MERWHKSDAYRKSLSDIGWDEEQHIQHDELALEHHSYIGTPAERARNEKHWVLSLNKEGVEGPMNQLPDFVEAKRELKRLHDEHVKETSKGKTPIHPVQRTRQRRNQQFDGLEEHNYQVDPGTGWTLFEVTGKPAASNIFVFIDSMGAARLELEQKLEVLAILKLN